MLRPLARENGDSGVPLLPPVRLFGLTAACCAPTGEVAGGWGIRLVDVGYKYDGMKDLLFEHVEFSINQVESHGLPAVPYYVYASVTQRLYSDRLCVTAEFTRLPGWTKRYWQVYTAKYCVPGTCQVFCRRRRQLVQLQALSGTLCAMSSAPQAHNMCMSP